MSHSNFMESNLEQPLRVGTVPYCNAWPLIHFLPTHLPGVILSEWFPSEMRLRLMAHHLDLALMPVAELMNLSYAKIVGNCCIACHGPVKSVRILSRKPLDKIETISLDTASRSSVTICELLLKHFYDANPTRYKLDPKKSLDHCKTDALVVIGDPALAYDAADHWEYRYDLGELWREKTGLPLVFAAWIGCSRRVFDNGEIVKALQDSRDQGLKELSRLIDERQRQDARFPVSQTATEDYLRNSIFYFLGEDERLGLQSFFDLALLHGMTKHRVVVEVVDCDD